jgi:type IV pilus assembly protein PilM
MQNLYTSIELNERECKILQLQRHKSGLKIRRALVIPFPSSGAGAGEAVQAKASAIKEALKSHKMRVPYAVLLIPKHLVTVRYVTLPSSSDEEISRMVRFEAERHIPFNAERHVVSHHVMKKEHIGGSHVLLAAADSSVVEEHLQVLTAAGIAPDVADVTSLALFNAFMFTQPEGLEDQTCALVNIGSLTTEICIVSRGLLAFTRSTSLGTARLVEDINREHNLSPPLSGAEISQIDMLEPETFFISRRHGHGAPGSQAHGQEGIADASEMQFGSEVPQFSVSHDIPGASSPGEKSEEDLHRKGEHPCVKTLRQWSSKLLTEITRTYSFAKREFECPPIKEVFVSGEGLGFKNMLEYMQVNLDVAVHPLQPFGQVEIEPECGLTDAQSVARFCVPLGGAIRGVNSKAIAVDVLPLRYVQHRARLQKKRSIITSGVLILVILALGIVYVTEQAASRNRLYGWYTTQIKQLEPEVKALQDKQTKLRIISSYINDKRSALAILDRISQFEFIPERVAFTDFTYKKGEDLEIEGHALEIKDLNTFEERLVKTGFFENVFIKQRPPYQLSYGRPWVIKFDLLCSFGKKKE